MSAIPRLLSFRILPPFRHGVVPLGNESIVFPDHSRTSRFPSLAKEGWREATGWFGMSASQAERLRNLQVRSASRAGYSDFGVNRQRVETFRARFSRTSNSSGTTARVPPV
jgi:hypothetical protein